MKRRRFFSTLVAAVGGVLFSHGVEASLFAPIMRRTNRRDAYLFEHSAHAEMSSHVLENPAAFHNACEWMRQSMLSNLRDRFKGQPITVERVPLQFTELTQDPKTGKYWVGFRQRVGREYHEMGAFGEAQRIEDAQLAKGYQH